MTQKYGIARFQAIKVSQLPPQDQQNPVVNNNPNSSKDGIYPYNAPQQRSQEPVVTSTSGTQSSKPESAEPDYGSRVGKLQTLLANRSFHRDVQQPPSVPTGDNQENLGIAKEQFNMQDVNYREMIPYLAKQADKDFNKMATYSAISGLGGAISGANAQYQQWWGGGLVK